MNAKILVFVFCFAASPVFARIGETPQQCQQRYGAPFKVDGRWTFFKLSGFGIMISFFEGKADSILYRKLEQSILGQAVEMSNNEIEKLLEINAGQSTWKTRTVISMDREWETEDGELIAFYKTFDNVLSICTMGWVERESAARKAKENKALDRF